MGGNLEDARVGRRPSWSNWIIIGSSVALVWTVGSLVLDAHDPTTDLFDEKAKTALMYIGAGSVLGIVLGVLLGAAFTPGDKRVS